jgi:hypothetical protein
MHYYTIVSKRWESLACAIYALCTRKTLSLCEDKQLTMPAFLSRRVRFFRNVIGQYKGKDYELHKQVVLNSILSEGLELNKNPLIQFQNKLFDTDKVANFYKRDLALFQYEFLRNLFLIKQKEHSFCLVLPKTKPYILLSDKYLKKNEYRLSNFFTIIYIGTNSIVFMASIIKGLLIKPAHRKPLTGLLLRESTWGFDHRGIRDNFLVDYKNIQESDYIYFTYKNTTDHSRIKAYEQAKERNYKIVVLDNTFNINRCFLNHIKTNFIFAFYYMFKLIYSPYLLPSITSFLSQSTTAHRLFSFCKVSCMMSTIDYDDIVMTIVANKFGTKLFLYHWSDMTPFAVVYQQHITHNELFLWGPIMKDFQYMQSKNENVYCIGCMFSNNFNDKSKKKLRDDIGLSYDKSIVTFYDSSHSDEHYYSEAVYEDFMQTMVDFAKKYHMIEVVLKPKFVLDEKYQRLLKESNIKVLNYKSVFVGDIIKASDVNVSMGMNSTTTISLLCDIPGLYYDTTENYDHPLSKYNGQLVFRDKENLFWQIENLLAGTVKIPKVPELKKYNVFNADPLEILRRYVKYGKVDNIYILAR